MRAEVSEKSIERYLNKRVRELGGISLKHSDPGNAGFPDRVILLPGGVTAWVELKSKGEKPGRLQSLRFAAMERIGHPVHVCDSKESVDDVLRRLTAKNRRP